MNKIIALMTKLKRFTHKHTYISATVACVLDCLIDYAISRIFHWDFLAVYIVDSVLSINIIYISVIINRIKSNRDFKSIKYGCVDPIMCAKINGN